MNIIEPPADIWAGLSPVGLNSFTEKGVLSFHLLFHLSAGNKTALKIKLTGKGKSHRILIAKNFLKYPRELFQRIF